jgi:transcriptional regulator with XRE-family HTH domain
MLEEVRYRANYEFDAIDLRTAVQFVVPLAWSYVFSARCEWTSMVSSVTARLSDDEYRVSLGKTVRELRMQRGLSQGALARAARMNSRHLSQIEHGDGRPDEEVLARIASALAIDCDTLGQAAETTHRSRGQLRELLQHLAIPHENWHEFLSLEPRVTAQVVERLQAHLPVRAGMSKTLKEVADEIERNGLEASVGTLLDGIMQHGLEPVDYLRNSVRMEELAGERIVFSDRLPLSPATVPIDELSLFRASYGIDPSNPMLLKWWSESRRSAVVATLRLHRSRTIVPKDQFERYIRTGQRGPNIVLPLDVVATHIRAVISLLRTYPNFMIGLSERHFPITYRAKGEQLVIASLSGYVLGPNPKGNKMMLRFERPAVARRFLAHFDATWEQIPDERRTNENVARWLEEQLVANRADS